MRSIDRAEEERLEAGRLAVAELVNRYLANAAYYQSNLFDETSTRTTFIDPFFQALGWDMVDSARKGAFADVLRERSIAGVVAGVSVLLKPDYTMRMGGQPQFCIEAKRPETDLDSPQRIFQVKNYAWNQNLTVCALTNFRKLRVFSTTVAPHVDQPWIGSVSELNLEFAEYVEAFDKLWSLLSYDAVRRGDLARRAEELVGGGLEQRVDRRFLTDLGYWRLLLAKDLAKSTELPGWELTEASQRMLDRLVFLRVCEDRHIEPAPVLKPLLTNADISDSLVSALKPFNVQYNGTLFKPHLIDDLRVSSDVLREIIESLYPPRSPYRFDVINVEILGTIYERFLGDQIERLPPKSVKIVRKPEVRKSGGVYYTPEWIVSEVTHLALEPLIAGKPPSQLSKLRILDPACGSGSFLLGAFDRLIREYEAYYAAHPSVSPRDHYQVGANRRLTERKKAEILTENIYGIDVDPQAVEVTMMSLYLKALEGEDRVSLNNQLAQQISLLKVAILPPLDRNIVCGNTLVGLDGFQLEFKSMKADEQRRLNPFDWLDPRYGFASVIKEGGFDAVIGNPPYFSVDATYGRHHPMLAYLQRAYPEIWQDKTDILFYFLAKGLQLTRRYLAFIISRAFFEAYKAAKLRGFLARAAACRDVVDFQGYKVFPDASISTAIVLFDRTERGKELPVRVRRLTEGDHPLESVASSLREGTSPFQTFEARGVLGRYSWIFSPAEAGELVSIIDGDWKSLSDIALVGQGMQTGENAAFGLTGKEVKDLEVPPDLVRRRVTNSDIDRFSWKQEDQWLLYLEEVVDYETLPPKIRAHLESEAQHQRLVSRAACIRGNCKWWQYTWPLHRAMYGRPRLVCPYRAGANRFVLDNNFSFLTLTDTTVVFPRDDLKESTRFWLALLNSRTLTYRMRFLAKLTGKAMYEYFWNSVAQLPMVRIDFSNPLQRNSHHEVVELARELEEDGRQSIELSNASGRSLAQRRFRAKDLALEELVMDLYGIKSAEHRALILSLF